jgi:hypothetical protein
MGSRHSTAIVLGASVGGLLAARALCDHFERVTVVERDTLLDGEELHGVPQSAHAHGLLTNGYRVMEEYSPGMMQESLAAGLDGLASRFYRRMKRIIDIPWLIATGEDLRFPRRQAPARFSPREPILGTFACGCVRRPGGLQKVFRCSEPVCTACLPHVTEDPLACACTTGASRHRVTFGAPCDRRLEFRPERHAINDLLLQGV